MPPLIPISSKGLFSSSTFMNGHNLENTRTVNAQAPRGRKSILDFGKKNRVSFHHIFFQICDLQNWISFSRLWNRQEFPTPF
jgi:hypothetical protein